LYDNGQCDTYVINEEDYDDYLGEEAEHNLAT
jgi:hypothetical protein